MTKPFTVRSGRVTVNRDAVCDFNRQWPCSELRSRSYWFEFDSCGDLIDMNVPASDDGAAALALADDCRAFLETGALPQWAI